MKILFTITPFNILDALKSIKFGKSSGVDGISAEHFVFAIVTFTFHYHCYFLYLLHMVTCQICS